MASDCDSDSDFPDGAADQDLSDGDLIVEDISDRGKITLIING